MTTTSTVTSVTKYADGTIRVTLQNSDGTSNEVDTHGIEATGLPPVELPIGQMVQAFIAAGGQVTSSDGMVSSLPSTPTSSILDVNLRQLCVALALSHKITEDEALSWIQRKSLPTEIVTAISVLPPADQFPAKALLFGAQSFQRSSTLATTLGSLLGLASDQIDSLWRSAALQ